MSKDIDKTTPYGDVTLKLLVYTGNVRKITSQTDPHRINWR